MILPIFINKDLKEKREIPTIPGVYNYPESDIEKVILNASNSGVKACLLFGVTGKKDSIGSYSFAKEGLVYRMISKAKKSKKSKSRNANHK